MNQYDVFLALSIGGLVAVGALGGYMLGWRTALRRRDRHEAAPELPDAAGSAAALAYPYRGPLENTATVVLARMAPAGADATTDPAAAAALPPGAVAVDARWAWAARELARTAEAQSAALRATAAMLEQVAATQAAMTQAAHLMNRSAAAIDGACAAVRARALQPPGERTEGR